MRLDREDVKDIKEALICDKDRRPLSYTCCIELFETIEGLYGDVDSLMEQLNRNIFAMDDAEATIEALQQENEQLQELAKAKADGRLLVLPCKVGTRVWVIGQDCDLCHDMYTEEPCLFGDCEYRKVIESVFLPGMTDEFGKTVFLTREEAEKALGVGE